MNKKITIPVWGAVIAVAAVAVCLLLSILMGYFAGRAASNPETNSASSDVAIVGDSQADTGEPGGEEDSSQSAQSDSGMDSEPGDAQPAETETSAEESTDADENSDTRVEALLDSMTVEEKVYQMFIVTPEALVDNAVDCVTVSGQTTKNAIENKPVGGIIYFSQNLESREQTTSMIENIQSYAGDSNHGVGLWIAVDEEGGRVARAADNLGTTAYSSMEYYGSRYDTDEAYDVGAGIAKDIRQFGFNLDFAPVADVNIDPNNELGDRIFSTDPQIVSDMSAAVVQGLQDNGVSATLKHFPGLGAANGNTHNDAFVHIDRTMEELRAEEFAAFQGGIDAGADFIMVGHHTVSAAGDNMPADLSSVVVTDWLRGELGYDGIVVTDAQNMGAISQVYSSSEAAVKAIQAGVDIVLMPANFNSAYNGVLQAVQSGQITEERLDESLRRILTAKEEHGLLK